MKSKYSNARIVRVFAPGLSEKFGITCSALRRSRARSGVWVREARAMGIERLLQA